MITDQQLKRITQVLSVLQDADLELIREFQQVAFLARIPAGQDVFMEGDRVDAIALLISGVVRVYQAIAAELGSSREVISRILEDFSQKGWVEVGRGTVEILDMDELLSCAVM